MTGILATYLVILGIIGYAKTKSALHPSFMLPLIWGLGSLSIFVLSPDDISVNTMFYQASAISVFWAGGLLGTIYSFRLWRRRNMRPAAMYQHHWPSYLYIALSLLLLCFYFLYSFWEFFLSGLSDYLTYARTNAIAGESLLAQQNFIVRKVPSVSFAGTVLYIYLLFLQEHRSGAQIILGLALLLATLVVAMAEGARSGAISLLIFIFFLYAANKKVRVKQSAYLGLAIFIIFGGLTIGMGSLSLEDQSSFIIVEIFWKMMWYYFSGIVYFDTVYNHFSAFELPSFITLANLTSLISKLGVSIDGSQNLLSEGLVTNKYVAIFFAGELRRGNVYTFLYPYVNDYGVLGSLIVLIFFGFLSGYAFVIRCTYYGGILYAYLMHAVVLSVFSDYFFSMILTVLYIIVLAVTIGVISKFSKYKN